MSKFTSPYNSKKTYRVKLVSTGKVEVSQYICDQLHSTCEATIDQACDICDISRQDLLTALSQQGELCI